MPHTHRNTVSKEYEEDMRAVANVIDTIFNGENCPKDKRKTGFALLIFPFKKPDDPDQGRVNYMSNAERKDMLTAMKEFIARAEGRHFENDSQH